MSDTPRTDEQPSIKMGDGRVGLALDRMRKWVLIDFARQLEREIAGFCRVIGEDNPVSAMVELKTMRRELAEAKKDTARLNWIRRNCEIHCDQGASTRIIEHICEIDDEINREVNNG